MTGESSSHEGPEPVEPESSPLTPEEEGDDDLKRKFREALERKRSEQVQGAAHADASKIRGTHGPAASQRSFRRKSGG
ncbi:DUF5302 domain-containing protein [Streptomyces resistomycificus]|uniref:DUF5302 domain-containing protein n=1 Tax=Streptomyces resistomycificus TaxID=67356 RepID=A0A0L8KPL2_9ACTN|nr:DUF5302 domain-containing protein [Streptomyces resistomycificus]KOG27862.1 hypothetical protein ADK37_40275 [Streptomyces resistomycificus]KUN95443.1 hypothetical protein AQJ84_22935 [Streptomyces resistomycificus]